jgi:hypothetical protein
LAAQFPAPSMNSGSGDGAEPTSAHIPMITARSNRSGSNSANATAVRRVSSTGSVAGPEVALIANAGGQAEIHRAMNVYLSFV